ncbi:MAG: V-type ATP synthase subunit F [Treponema sp.]|nr:V-type ATP synthase subunit F [Treponema sp.]MBR4629410.1 V-type ATP synthase subunit F [Treponema sp.]MBR6912683.1 V-type ATP synthase subunit F [Treponema sp.]
MEYFVIGEREIVLAFKLVGVDGSVSVNRTEALDAFNRITGRGGIASVPASERPKVLILTEEVSSMLEDEVLDWQKGVEYPLIVEIPGIRGHLEGKKTLTDSIREAIGIQV